MKAYVESEKPDIAADPVVKLMDSKVLRKRSIRPAETWKRQLPELDFIEAARFRDEMEDLKSFLKATLHNPSTLVAVHSDSLFPDRSETMPEILSPSTKPVYLSPLMVKEIVLPLSFRP